MAAGSNTSPVFDFSSIDFQGLESDLIRYAQAQFPSEKWTNLNASDEGRRLIELAAYVGDLLSYTENAHVQEVTLKNCIREQNFRNIAEAFDYVMKSASPAQTTLRYTLDPAYLPLFIPKTDQVADKLTGKVIYEPNIDGTAVTTTYDVDATQGETSSVELLGVSSGNALQQYQLANSPLLDGTLVVNVGNSSYVVSENPVAIGPNDLAYFLKTDENGVTTLTFGDNINGRIPPIGQNIVATYRYGGGSQGNGPIDSITRLVSTRPGVLSVTNITIADGGGPKQSLQNAKKQLPLFIKANDRAITVEDYAAKAVDLVSGVLRARGISGRYQAGGSAVNLFLVPQGGGPVQSVLANQVVSAIRFGVSANDYGRGLAGKRIICRTAVYVNLLIVVDAFVIPGSSSAVVSTAVTTAFQVRYNLNTVDFADVFKVQLDGYDLVDPGVEQIDGLDHVFLRKFSVEANAGRYVNLPTTGNGTIEGIVATDKVDTLEWNVNFVLGAAPVPEYAVTRRVVGTITQLSDLTLTDDSGIFVGGALVGKRLRPRQEDQVDSWLITSNTQKSITVVGTSLPGTLSSMLFVSAVGDQYAVETIEALIGRVVRAIPNGDYLAGILVVTIDNATGILPGHSLLVREGLSSAVLLVANVVGNVITFSSGLPFDVHTTSTFDWYWVASDGTLGFAVIQGSGLFVVGDNLYVDTYAAVGDIRLRKENFPLLDNANLIVNTIGGVR